MLKIINDVDEIVKNYHKTRAYVVNRENYERMKQMQKQNKPKQLTIQTKTTHAYIHDQI